MSTPMFAPVSAKQFLRKAGDVAVVIATADLRLARRVLGTILRTKRLPIGALENVVRVSNLLEVAERMSRGARAVTFDVPVEDALMGGMTIGHLARNHADLALADSARRHDRGAIKPGHQGEAIAAFRALGESLVNAARAGAAGIGELVPAGEASP